MIKGTYLSRCARINQYSTFICFDELVWKYLSDKIFKNFQVGKYFTIARKSILYLVKLQSLVAKYCKIKKI